MPPIKSILRIWLACGHGLSNSVAGQFDPGATSCYGSEHEIVSELADKVLDEFFLGRDEKATPTHDITVIEVPRCSSACLAAHPKKLSYGELVPISHLAWQVQYLNDNAAIFDYIIALHMNDAPGNEDASGTIVIYDNAAPRQRIEQARRVSKAIAATLGIPDRGAMADSRTPRRSIAIVEKTHAPALLIELGFVTNKRDVEAVRECGAEAIIAGIEALRKEPQ